MELIPKIGKFILEKRIKMAEGQLSHFSYLMNRTSRSFDGSGSSNNPAYKHNRRKANHYWEKTKELKEKYNVKYGPKYDL